MIFFILLLFSLYSTANSLIISTSLGDLNGDQIGNYHVFKKVPFARPPVGKLRFQKPEAVEKWNGTLDARYYGPACMSNSSVTHSPQKWVDEDCLHLNIFTSEKCLESKDCAVVFYLHGGGIEYDSAVMFNETFLVYVFPKEDVLLVIPAYRLGIFSHFVLEDQSIAPNNLALYDILLALEFVHHEIHHFGGNHRKITLLGHSYGGSIAAMLSFSPRINQDLSLFQRAIIMSSSRDLDTLEAQVNRTMRFVEHANCVPSGTGHQKERDTFIRDCLLDKTGMELLRIQRELEDLGYDGYNGLVIREPLFDESIPYSKFMDNPKNIPTMIGCTRYEHDHESNLFPIGESMGFENFKEVEEKYQLDKKEGNYDFHNHSDETQAIMVQTIFRANKLLENNVTTYLYEYTYPKHARHTDDLFYIMGVHSFEMDENERLLAQVYVKMFANFAKFGEPRVPGFEETTRDTHQYFNVFWNETSGERPSMKEHFEQNIISYWFNDMITYDKNITAQKLKNSPKITLKSQEMVGYYYPANYRFFSIYLVLLLFLMGFLAGKCCFSTKRNLYIRLDGSDDNNYEQIIKNF